MAKFLSTPEVAEKYGYTTQAVRDWVQSGKLRAEPKVGKNYKFSQAELRQFELRQREANKSTPGSPSR
jgi:excisionase family DNA binding protein